MRFVADAPTTPYEVIGRRSIHLPVSAAIADSLVRMTLPSISNALESVLVGTRRRQQAVLTRS